MTIVDHRQTQDLLQQEELSHWTICRTLNLSLDLTGNKSGIPKPSFQAGKTRLNVKITKNPYASLERLTTPCKVLLRRLDDTHLREIKTDNSPAVHS